MPYKDPQKRRDANARHYAKHRPAKTRAQLDRALELRRRRYVKDPEAMRQSARTWMKANPLSYMLGVARRRAKEKGMAFEITAADFPILPTHCPVLGLELAYGAGNGKRGPNSASIDRRDGSKGYVPGNVEIISWRANDLKKDATADELRRVLDYVTG